MQKILDAIGRDKINRFTLAFKDAELEKEYLDEFNKNLHRLLAKVGKIFIIFLPSWFLLILILKPEFLTFLIYILFLAVLIIISIFLITLIYFRPNPHVTQLIMITNTISYAIFIPYFYGIYWPGWEWLGAVFVVFTIFITAAVPCRFVFSIPCYITVILFSTLISFASPQIDIYSKIVFAFLLLFFSIISIFMLYQKEASSRLNFYRQQIIEQSEAKIREYSDFLKKMFGRYLSTEVMNTLIENPSALELGGEKREVTIMMTDLRGFVALTERLKPEKVVEMLNAYFEVMVDIVLKYNGTINEIIGDALLVIFGAPQEMPDRADKAIACAIDMQNAMANVNTDNRNNGLPELEMGIGINEDEVIVGNIGSSKRSKYTVVGSGVNLTSRIESYTVGGQILISESVKNKVGEKIRIDNQMEVMPKGADSPLKLFEVGGISGDYNLMLLNKDYEMAILTQKIPFQYKILDEKQVGKAGLKAFIKKLSKAGAEIVSEEPLERLSNLKINLADVDDDLGSKDLYAKVVEKIGENFYILRFTSLPAEIASYFQAFRRHLVQGEGSSF